MNEDEDNAVWSGWMEIRTEQDIQYLYDIVREFHDSIVVKTEWTGRDVVNEKGSSGSSVGESGAIWGI